jgi:hypothetical protein
VGAQSLEGFLFIATYLRNPVITALFLLCSLKIIICKNCFLLTLKKIFISSQYEDLIKKAYAALCMANTKVLVLQINQMIQENKTTQSPGTVGCY